MESEPDIPGAARWPQIAVGFGTGGLLTLMVLFNGMMGAATTPFFSSLAAHGTGTLAAAALVGLVLLRGGRRGAGAGGGGPQARAPWWSYLAGLAGAVTVMLSAVTVNSALALSGTLALGLAGQVVFGLVADRLGLFGLPARGTQARDLAALGLIAAGSLMIIFLGGGP
jgi:transporter family-2 protein